LENDEGGGRKEGKKAREGGYLPLTFTMRITTGERKKESFFAAPELSKRRKKETPPSFPARRREGKKDAESVQ